MPYITKDDIKPYISTIDLISFLDDDRDGSEDSGLWDAIVASCSMQADGYVSNIYATPFGDPAPSKIRSATLIFVCEALYERRLTPDEKNPFKSRADVWRSILEKVGEEGIGLDVNTPRDFTPGFATTEAIAFSSTTL